MISYKVDFHTHSILSHDGGIGEKDYQSALLRGLLDYIAITDHNTTDYALFCQKKFGERIIVGEEISTRKGEIIGLFLKKTIPSLLSLAETIANIKAQGGLVYIPHPFDTQRFAIGEENMLAILSSIDIIETFNARMIFPIYNKRAKIFAEKYHIASSSGSDAHSGNGLGFTYAILNQKINKNTLDLALKESKQKTNYLPIFQYGVPFWNRIKHYVFK